MPEFQTDVAIVGAGPAGLMLAHLLHIAGIDSVVIDNRSHDEIAHTHRAGILEAGSVRMLESAGIESRVHTEGHRHDGIDIRVNGISHSFDFPELVDDSVWLYPQNEIFVDLAAARAHTGRPTFYSVTDTRLGDVETERPWVSATTEDGENLQISAHYVVGADGSRGPCRSMIPDDTRQRFFHEYPFAWFGILCEAPPSHEVLIYSRSERGFALISQRSANVQRMYFQTSPDTEVTDWSDDRIWSELQSRVDGPDGFQLKTGPIIDKTVLPFRSAVTEPMQHGSLFLAGDSAHTVPPTGAKGLNLAFADVSVLAPALIAALRDSDAEALAGYSQTATKRVWKAQNFSYQMTRMLHTDPGADAFETKRSLGELGSILDSDHGRRYLAECYTGWPHG
ncbi:MULTISPECIES: 4-hydroxybenzoate 3-monooxygenase [unclassified Brevibacterium]|uniref:4-hydroxybenzoate 3-monooxygenase n=1 Tax=unclassified Brevibacterium TaxID=2614124 RepID=UPI001E29D8D6|nr:MULTISPECIES: 4-hydroxybenzoate 3-monooxygenase [unclassified Brevibacterium]MCD1287403.1 4-hydroxybenzoate 3-monooxygenase [Brevibacterium sp. CCUG 69071]MDK8436799.1 4-hydroxybenzoate 3-monooxygenase [Brevibacterium sp. H-BE7]